MISNKPKSSRNRHKGVELFRGPPIFVVQSYFHHAQPAVGLRRREGAVNAREGGAGHSRVLHIHHPDFQFLQVS